MNGLLALLTILAWYHNKRPSEAKAIFKDIVNLIEALDRFNKFMEHAMSNMELSDKEVEMLYFTLFKNEYESELISAINEFMRAGRELDLFTAGEREKIERILNDLINNLAMISILYEKKSNKESDFTSNKELWSE